MKPANRRWYRDGQLEREQAEYDLRVTEGASPLDGYTMTLHSYVRWHGMKFLDEPTEWIEEREEHTRR